MRRFARTMFGTLATFVWAVGCASIVGIDDDTVAPTPVDSPECVHYCDAVMSACTGNFAAYTTRTTCLGACRSLPPGDPLEPTGATVACRTRQAELAASTREPAAYCPQAGPGGAGVCGTNCTAYCALLASACPKEFGVMPNCPLACAALKDTGKLDVVANHEGDTIQCRLVHVSSATVEPRSHCPHSALAPTEWCIEAADKPPDCAEFCRFNQAGCAGDLAVYESTAQCMAVCAALPPGTNADREENTMGCRHWHTFNSLIDPASHCSHTAPGGDGHCGLDSPDKTGNCAAYCMLVEKACATGFAAQYASQTACQLDCSTRPDSFGAKHDSKYRVATAVSGNTLQCRILHASRALTAPEECTSALGQGACQ
jgi:hypothetical protein